MLEPSKKKPRMSNHPNERFNDVLKELVESKMNLKPILREALAQECAAAKFYVGKIKDRKAISKVIMKLATVMPLNDFNHLKRIRNSEVLLCSSDAFTNDELRSLLEKEELLLLLDDEISICEVASEQPALRWQYDIAQKLWPCNFHPNKYLEKLSGGAFFDPEQVRRHRTFMRVAFEVALLTNQSDTIESMKGAVVVDPKIDSVVAVGYDRRSEHPCQHAVMMAIDNVAKSQGGGAWPPTEQAGEEMRGIPASLLDDLTAKYPTVKFGARPFKKRDLQQVEPEELGPYICTGYEVYATSEPCIMCSMALVHARISRVFFATRNPETGGLVSKCKLHDVKDLNHHYEVFSGFLDNTNK